MNPVYKFYLQAGDSDTLHEAYPVYGGNLALNYELEREQRFFRAKLSGKLTFLRADYDRIMAATFGTVFYLHLYKNTDAGATQFSPYYTAKFSITDCTVNTDDRTIVVQPQTIDRYTDVLAGIDNEYNLITLTPAMNAVSAYKRPLVQVYEAGADFLNCYIAGTSWEQDCTAEDDKDQLGTHYFFGLDSVFIQADITKPQYAGRYRGVMKKTGVTGDYEIYSATLQNEQGATQYSIDVNMLCLGCNYGSKWYGFLYLKDGDTTLYTCTVGSDYGQELTDFDSGNYVFEGDDDDFQFYLENVFMMARWLTDATSVPDITLYDLPSDDIGDVNKNYHKVARVTAGTFTISTNVSSTPTEYGVANDAGTLYYAPPTGTGTDWFLPVVQSQWQGQVSFWFLYSAVFQYLENVGRAAYTMRNAYPLWSCISVLLGQISSVTFAGTSDYSQFLYGSLAMRGTDVTRLFVTPKSNVLAGDYSTPAQKAMTTLGKFLDMLRNLYQLYWYIDESNRLRIEHISWFKNGGSYSGSPQVGIDLTTLLERRNDTPWGYGVNEYSYEKFNMAQRYQFQWMDDARIPFMGDAIEMLSPAVEEGKVEEVNMGDFSADLDYMLLNPSVFSQDGFALMGCIGSGNSWAVPFLTYQEGSISITIQNGYLSMYYIEPNYWIYDLPAKSVRINGVTYTLSNVARHKQQKVSVPMDNTEVDFLKLVKTGLGNGEIRAYSLPLTSRVAQLTLNYDTE